MPYILIWLNRCWGIRRLSSGLPPSIWLCRGRRSKWLLWGNPPSPSQKGDLLVICIRITISYRISPRCWCGVSGGHIQLSESDLPVGILHELSQLVICKIPKVCLQVLQSSPTWVGVVRGRMGFLLLIGGQRYGTRWFPIYCCHIGLHEHGRWWGSPNSNGFFSRC